MSSTPAPAPSGASMLVLGGTGRTGARVVADSLRRGIRVTVFARDPSRVPAADVAAGVHVVKGDLKDLAALAAAVKAVRPTSVVFAASSLPMAGPSGVKNDAPLLGAMRTVVDALVADGREGECVIVSAGGVLVPEPGGTIKWWSTYAMATLISVLLPALYAEGVAGVNYMFNDTPPALRFVMVRMGGLHDGPSQGAVKVEATADNIQRASVTYGDMGAAFVDLALDPGPWARKAVFVNY